MSNGQGGGPQSPLDFDLSKLPKMNLPKLPKGGASRLPLILVLVLVALLLSQTFYTIDTDEIGILLRLGRYRGAEHNADPGLRWKLPLIDRLYRVPIQRQLKEEFGFRTEAVGVRSSFSQVNDEAAMLTGDANVAIVEWVVQYRIVDPYLFVFKVRNVTDTFRDMSEAAMRKVVGDRTVNEVVTIGRVEIETEVERELQAMCEQYENGIRVEKVLLQSNNPPEPVKPSFNAVNQAEQDLNKLVNEAQAQYNQVIPRAQGEALQAIEQAEGYALERVNQAEGDAARFVAFYEEYRKAPEVTRQRIYLETLDKVLPNVGRKLVIDKDLEGLVPILNLEAVAGAAAARREGGS